MTFAVLFGAGDLKCRRHERRIYVCMYGGIPLIFFTYRKFAISLNFSTYLIVIKTFHSKRLIVVFIIYSFL